MQAKEDDIDTLTVRVRQGDQEAAVSLQRQLEPVMVHHVLQALTSGRGTNPMARWILAEARPIATRWPRPGPDSAERLITQVARHMCCLVVSRVARAAKPRQALTDTVSCA